MSSHEQKTAVAVSKPKTPRAKAEAAPVTETQALIYALAKASRDPKVDIVKMDWLLKTRMALLADEAEQAFNEAMTRGQAAMRPVARDANNPQTRSKYASYVALDRALRPVYTAESFALSFNTGKADDPDSILVVCDVTHGRHSKRYQIPMPADGKGARGNDVMTKTHATGSAVSYGMRYLLRMIFNISVGEHDDDGNLAGNRGPANVKHMPAISAKQETNLLALMEEADVGEDIIREHFKVEKLADLTEAQFNTAVNKCKAKLNTL